ncbi:hypothetical protein [Phenylobacterium ferrooxidans]|uniref:Phage tail protein n=1 Tax=Phenylobacterium ferrooxidans TaxID=2982689 RepID=A0ABW6CK93_9CAUL
MLYALVSPAAEILGYRVFSEVPEGIDVAAHKPRYLPVENEDAPSVDAVTQVCEGPVEVVTPTAVVRTWTVRAKSPQEVAGMREAKVAQVKAQAAGRILALYPEWKQRNLTARAVVLLRIAQDRAWTPQEAQESADLEAAWAAVDAIRTRSNEIEAQIPAGAAAIAAFDVLQGWD